jgi:hypothetical protein
VTDGGTFTILASAIGSQGYIALGLTMGTTYTFKVAARNSYGISDYSDEIDILAA